MMKIIFDNNANESPLLSRSPSLPKQKAPKSEESGQLEQLLSEFILTNESGPPLAVIVVHRTVQSDRDEEVDSLPVVAAQTTMSWTAPRAPRPYRSDFSPTEMDEDVTSADFINDEDHI